MYVRTVYAVSSICKFIELLLLLLLLFIALRPFSSHGQDQKSFYSIIGLPSSLGQEVSFLPHPFLLHSVAAAEWATLFIYDPQI